METNKPIQKEDGLGEAARAPGPVLFETQGELAPDLIRIQELTARLAASGGLKQVLHEILLAVTGLQSTEMGDITLCDAAEHGLRPVANIGLSEECLRLIDIIPLGVGPCGMAARDKRNVVVEDVETDPSYAPFLDVARIAGYSSVFSTPMITPSGEVVGTIATIFRERHRPSEREIRLVELYARQAALAVENARLLDALRLEEERFRVALKGSSIWVFNQDAELRYTWSYNVMSGQDDAMVGKRDTDLFFPEQAAALTAIKRGVLGSGAVAREELFVNYEGGSGRCYDVVVEPLRNASGEIIGITGAAMDITERKLLETRVQEKQKLESVGLLAGGLAHDFNNLLTSIIGCASLALEQLAQGHPSRSLLAEVLHTSERAAQLTQQLLAYSGRGRFFIQPVDLDRAVRDVIDLVRTTFIPKLALKLELQACLPPLQADANQIRQLITALVMNAAEALDECGGEIVVVTGEQTVAGRVSSADFVGAVPEDGRYVFLEVRDTGPGMSEQLKARIFEPFFTTKMIGRGLGLSAVLGIVRGHKGSLQVRTAPGRGSVFRVLLPMREWQIGPILVVDDEPAIRTLAKLTLEQEGYPVLLAGDGREALRLLSDAALQISLVLLDLSGMSGAHLMTELRKHRPGVPVIVSTDYDEEEARRQCEGEAIAGILTKPYTPARLVQTVRGTGYGKKAATT